MQQYYDLMDSLCVIVRQAGEIIMRYYDAQEQTVTHKEDDSPVTEADIAANHFIVEHLTELAPEIPAVSEEGDKPQMAATDRFWLVDPVDGTKSFIRREGEFTVNIGLVEKGVPVLGVIYLPAQDVCYWGAEGRGAWRQLSGHAKPEKISVSAPSDEELKVVASLAHFSGKTKQFLEGMPVSEKVRAASSLKFCRVAEGTADLYPRFGPTMEWDTAAGHAILNAAGGRVETPEGEPLVYGKPEFLNSNFIAWGH